MEDRLKKILHTYLHYLIGQAVAVDKLLEKDVELDAVFTQFLAVEGIADKIHTNIFCDYFILKINFRLHHLAGNKPLDAKTIETITDIGLHYQQYDFKKLKKTFLFLEQLAEENGMEKIIF